MEQNQFVCTGDCTKCSSAQRQYCACQHSLNSMRLIQTIQQTIAVISGTIEEIKNKISAIQDNEALIFDPNAEKMTIAVNDIAQEGSGA